MSISLQNKVALVTGANRGIGKAIVESFLAHGVSKVYLAVRNPQSTHELEARYGDRVVTLPFDASNVASVQALAARADDVDILVNNAGVLVPSSPLAENVFDALSIEFDVNVLGLLRVVNEFADTLERRQGVLVQMNSVASIKNFAELSTYSASKAASYSLTQGLREKLGEKGVSVLSVHPGPIDTEMAATAGFEGGESTSNVSEAIVAALEAGEFHLFPDAMAKQFEGAYQSFSENIVMANFAE